MTNEDGTVFLIDDDPGVRDSLTLLLSLKGMRTQPFANAESFIETYRPDWSGCVLTDLRMPGMTGLELQAVLRERQVDRKSTRLNSSHVAISYAVFCLK